MAREQGAPTTKFLIPIVLAEALAIYALVVALLAISSIQISLAFVVVGGLMAAGVAAASLAISRSSWALASASVLKRDVLEDAAIYDAFESIRRGSTTLPDSLGRYPKIREYARSLSEQRRRQRMSGMERAKAGARPPVLPKGAGSLLRLKLRHDMVKKLRRTPRRRRLFSLS